MTRLSLSLLTLAGLLTVTTAYAKVYKWVDEQGQVHYTQQKPAVKGIEAKEVDAPPPPPADSIDPVKQWEKYGGGDKKATGTEAPKEAQSKEELKKQQCETAKKNLDVLKNRARVTYKNAAGETVKMGEDERKARLDDAQKSVNFYCD